MINVWYMMVDKSMAVWGLCVIDENINELGFCLKVVGINVKCFEKQFKSSLKSI